jgi:hypothetical protein
VGGNLPLFWRKGPPFGGPFFRETKTKKITPFFLLGKFIFFEENTRIRELIPHLKLTILKKHVEAH